MMGKFCTVCGKPPENPLCDPGPHREADLRKEVEGLKFRVRALASELEMAWATFVAWSKDSTIPESNRNDFKKWADSALTVLRGVAEDKCVCIFTDALPHAHSQHCPEYVSKDSREALLNAFRKAMGKEYPARWVDERTTKGDFGGRDTTVDVFNVPVNMQLELLKRLRSTREMAKRIVGSSCMFIFHTPDATAEYYSEVAAEVKEG